MIYLEVEKTTKKYASRKTIGEIFDYKDPSKLLRGFRQLADERPSVFKPCVPYIENKGLDRLYNIICFAFYLENKDLLESGTRSIKFSDELPRLKEVYWNDKTYLDEFIAKYKI